MFLCMCIRWKRNGGTKAKRTGLQVRILISQKQMQMPLIVPDPESIKLYLVCQVPTRINCLMRVVTQLLTKALQNLWHLSKITFAKMGLMMGVSWLHIVKLCFRVAASSGTGVEWEIRGNPCQRNLSRESFILLVIFTISPSPPVLGFSQGGALAATLCMRYILLIFWQWKSASGGVF